SAAARIAVAPAAGPDGRGWRVSQVVPFSSALKWSGAVLADAGPASGGWVLGAPEVLLAPGEPARAEAEQKAAAGLRVLALGRAGPAALASPGELGPRPDGHGQRFPVTPVALVVLRQRLRSEAPRTLAYFAEQGNTFAHIVLAAANEIAMMIARAEDPAAALSAGESAVAEFLDRLVGGPDTP
ncbi:MAG: cation-translocating P-type ATPase, partial [Nocardiopsaceae bacterium]|nr:cation-translocating P-type ATPase [Nocardiopsaceae bacterium]